MIFRLLWLLPVFLCTVSCKNPTTSATSDTAEGKELTRHAESFSLLDYGSYKILIIKQAWPDADKEFKYLLLGKDEVKPNQETFDAVIEVPVRSLVVTSTTHLPSLEMLKAEEKLIGFPNLNYISSPKIRGQIEAGKVRELGKNEDINTEVLIDLSPAVVVGFAMDGSNPAFTTIQNTGIPVLYNADWTENSPLGKAEWIKFFGALLDKDAEAEDAFSQIETAYQEAKSLATNTTDRPTVLSGAMFQDVWHLPKSDSWGAQFIADAGGDYLWKSSRGTGALSLSPEAVLDRAVDADVWIGPAHFYSFDAMSKSNKVYEQFKAFRNREVYTYTAKKNAFGGIEYFELAPNRPDLVLKDLIKIFHPQLLPEYQLYFFEKLQ